MDYFAYHIGKKIKTENVRRRKKGDGKQVHPTQLMETETGKDSWSTI